MTSNQLKLYPAVRVVRDRTTTTGLQRHGAELVPSSECSDNPQLLVFDKLQRKCITDAININMNDNQWTKAFLPVKNRGLGIRRAGTICLLGIGCRHTANPERHLTCKITQPSG